MWRKKWGAKEKLDVCNTQEYVGHTLFLVRKVKAMSTSLQLRRFVPFSGKPVDKEGDVDCVPTLFKYNHKHRNSLNKQQDERLIKKQIP